MVARQNAVAKDRPDRAGRGGSKAREGLAPVRGRAKAAAGSGAGDQPEGALELDRLIHERLRLGIVSALAVNDRLTFNDLKRLMKTTDGNLSVHARRLEEAG